MGEILWHRRETRREETNIYLMYREKAAYSIPFIRRKTMEQQNLPQSTMPMTKKLAYEPPKATFVPLKVEDRLLETVNYCGDCKGFND